MFDKQPIFCDFARAHGCAQSLPTLAEIVGQAQVIIEDARTFAPKTPEGFVNLTLKQHTVLALAGKSIEALTNLRKDLPTLCGNCVLNPLVNTTIPELTKDLGK